MENMKIIIIFAVLSIINVIGSTARSIVTIKSGKTVAAISNALYFAFYNIVMIYTVADFPLWIKCAVTFGCNLIGVFVVKWIEEKRAPVKMWKIEMAVKLPNEIAELGIKETIESNGIPCNFNRLGSWTIYNCYCETCDQSAFMNGLCKQLGGKISAYESKNL